MAGLATALDAYLWEAARTPFGWGASDCSLFLADWVKDLRRVDPAAAWRGRYRTELGCKRLVKREGGLPMMMGRACDAAGLIERPVARLQVGDVGLVLARTACAVELVPAICTGDQGAAVRSLRGVIFGKAAWSQAWSV